MLTQLVIRDFAIVHKLDLNLRPGLTVLTGETGAGKSILIDALALALGERADAGVIRHGCERSEITVGFELKPDQDAARWLAEHELAADGECLLRRVIETSRPSKAYINGRPVPVQMLRELGELLVDIHGQHEHQSLLKRDIQRQTLDDYAGLGAGVADLVRHYQTLRALEERRDHLGREGADRSARLELLRYQVGELTALALGTDELPQLEEEHARLANANELLQGAQAVAQVLYDDEEQSASRILAQALHRLESLGEFDARLGALAGTLSEAAIQIDDVAGELHRYLDNLELDPERLAWVDQRLAAAHDLARKHRVRPEELPAVLARLATELADLEDSDVSLDKLDRDIATARAGYLKLAGQISAKRKTAAGALGEGVTTQMQRLGLAGGRFEIALTPLDPGQLAAHGLERIEFLVSANPGQPLKPLNKVASGGELSRISLGLQVVTAQVGRIPTLVFDEVDVGIGGGVAEIVGGQLRTLGRSRQVLCITHLPQVAAQGHQHLQVSKHIGGDATLTTIQPLPEPARVDEIARMLGGVEITGKTKDLAADMLRRALEESHVPA